VFSSSHHTVKINRDGSEDMDEHVDEDVPTMPEQSLSRKRLVYDE